ncbi:hypothetical protein [Pasteuria penetrans]|uniref:hypothetical protein n=1 Tax=Pasteuria penetrans TaxID=86005 RepID=UPI0011F03388|nr:hypothetical protein [Pasteuria penetrans]
MRLGNPIVRIRPPSSPSRGYKTVTENDPQARNEETKHDPSTDDFPSITSHNRKDKDPRDAPFERDGYQKLHNPKIRDQTLCSQHFFDDLKKGITLRGSQGAGEI